MSRFQTPHKKGVTARSAASPYLPRFALEENPLGREAREGAADGDAAAAAGVQNVARASHVLRPRMDPSTPDAGIWVAMDGVTPRRPEDWKAVSGGFRRFPKLRIEIFA